MSILKHIDFQVPVWGELSLGPVGGIDECFRPFRFRAVGFRPSKFRPAANHGSVRLGG